MFISGDTQKNKFHGYDVKLTEDAAPWTVTMVFASDDHDIFVFYDGIKLITKEKRCGCCAPVISVKDVQRPYGRFESKLVTILNVKNNGPEFKWMFGEM